LFWADGAGSPFLDVFVSMRRSIAKARGGEGERTGPPIAPRRIASAPFAAASAASVSGVPWASIEACR
jgi:hypothetical protein